MDDSFLADLRCPLDPLRQATFSRESSDLVCSTCQTSFPVKNGIPVLTPDEARLPSGIHSPERLPCVRHARDRV